jgi:hypothetical protein
MRANLYTNVTLTAIAIFLGILALRPLTKPPSVSAQYTSSDAPYLYIEPRTTVIRKPDGSAQMQGKVVIDMRTGDVWGFPTLEGVPYPVDRIRSQPPVSEPMYLGKFDFTKMRREEKK